MAEKKLTKTQKMILSRAADKPLLNYGDFGDAQRRTIDKAADLLEEWGMIEHKMGTGWHITPAGLAAIGRTSAAPEAAREDAPAMELCRTPPLYMEMANMNGGLVGAQQLEIEELRQEVAKLLKSEQEDEYIDEPILSKPLYTVTVDNCCGEVEALREENTALKADRVRNLARNTALEDALKLQNAAKSSRQRCLICRGRYRSTAPISARRKRRTGGTMSAGSQSRVHSSPVLKCRQFLLRRGIGAIAPAFGEHVAGARGEGQVSPYDDTLSGGRRAAPRPVSSGQVSLAMLLESTHRYCPGTFRQPVPAPD